METYGRYCLPVHPRPPITQERPVRIAMATLLAGMALNGIVSHGAAASNHFLQAVADIAAVCGGSAYLVALSWTAYRRRND